MEVKRDKFLPQLISFLDNKLYSPEEVIIKQGDSFDEKTSAMYFIGRGDCKVDITAHNGVEELAYRTMAEGDHFGEVALLYQCHRSASVVSRNYNTMAVLLYKDFQQLKTVFPEFELELKKYVKKNYNDSKVKFLRATLKRIPYFDKIEEPKLQEGRDEEDFNQDLLTRLVFSLKPRVVEKDETFLGEG